MKWRYQFINAFATKFATNYNIQIWVDGVLPLVNIPDIDEWKYFWLTLSPYDDLKRYVLRCYKEWWVVKYHWYDVTDNRSYLQNDDVILSDVAEYLNYLSDNTDDIWFTVNVVSNWIVVYWWEILLWDTTHVIDDKNIPLTDLNEWVNYIYLDYTVLDFVVKTDWNYEWWRRVATVMVNLWNVVSIVDDRRKRVPYNYSSTYFEIVDWSLQIKDNSIWKDQIDFSTFTTDDITEWTTNLYFTENRVLNISAIQQLIADEHTHSNKALLDTYTFENDDVLDAIAKKHTHDNKDLLDEYTFTNADILDTISKAHTHNNKITLDAIPNYITAWVWTVLTRTASWLSWEVWTWWGWWWAYIPWAVAVRETFTWDWINDTIILSATPSSLDSLFVFNDSGQLYFEWIDYTISWNVITLTDTPDDWRKIYVTYFVWDYGWYASAWSDTFIWDWSTTTFFLSEVPVNNNVVFVFNDSWQIYFEWVDYTLTWQQIDFINIPENWRRINVRYFTDDSVPTNSYSMVNLPWTWIWTYYQTVSNTFQVRRITWTWWISVYEDPTTHNIVVDWNVTPWTWWEANYWVNVWWWAEIYKWKNWVILEFRTLEWDWIINPIQADDNIILNLNEDNLSPRLYRYFMFAWN